MKEVKKEDTIALGVCSSISIYKACEIARGFQKKGFQVQVILTKNASRLVSPLLFSSLTGLRAICDLFTDEHSERIAHIDLAKNASLLLVAPATANMIGKMASGVADDFLSTFYLAFSRPVLIAPAMNESMYLHPQTQLNIQKLKSVGVQFIEPEKGYLACEEEGWGRLALPEKIVQAGMSLLRKSQSFRGKTVLVTAGPTREFLDPIRFLTNSSSGKMGFELADEALRRGADVILVSGPSQLWPPRGAKFVGVQTSDEMAEAVESHFEKCDIVIMAAAVSDFKFSRRFPQKVKKQKIPEELKLVKTGDIVKSLGKRKRGKILVGFAAETENLEANAALKIKEKNLDMIVANNVLEEGTGFGSDFNKVTILYPNGKKLETGKKSKREISQIIFDEIEKVID